jgi:hypothetical protein
MADKSKSKLLRTQHSVNKPNHATKHRPYQVPPTVDLEKSRFTSGCAAIGLRIVYHVKKMASASAMYSIRLISDSISAPSVKFYENIIYYNRQRNQQVRVILFADQIKCLCLAMCHVRCTLIAPICGLLAWLSALCWLIEGMRAIYSFIVAVSLSESSGFSFAGKYSSTLPKSTLFHSLDQANMKRTTPAGVQYFD